jgi:hypothetical protein
VLSRLSRRLSYANVMSTIAVVVAVGTGSAYAANTVFSSDIVDGQVKSVDVGDAEIKSADVKDQSLTTFDVSTFIGADIVDGSLTAKDVGENAFNLSVNVPAVAAHDCLYMPITGIAAEGDHLLLTPDYRYTSSFLTYNVEYQVSPSSSAQLKVCNPTNTNELARPTFFNLLVFQH